MTELRTAAARELLAFIDRQAPSDANDHEEWVAEWYAWRNEIAHQIIAIEHESMHDARDCPECDYRMAVSTSLDTGHSPSCPARKGNPCEDAVCGANAIRMLLEDIIAGRTTLAAAMEPKGVIFAAHEYLAGGSVASPEPKG
jgi:hypothetical protein